MAKIGDRSDDSRRLSQTKRSTPQAKAKPATPAVKSSSSQSAKTRDVSSNREASPQSKTVKALDREPSKTQSNPSASRDVTQRQSSVAKNLTSEVSDFDSLAEEDDGAQIASARSEKVSSTDP